MICAPCLAHPPRHTGIAAGTLYNDASRQLVLAFKHGGKIALAPMLAGLIAPHLTDADENDPSLLVPVPLHRWRLWKRGYNQAALLAHELAKLGKGKLMLEGLERHRATPSLGGLGRSARQRAIAGSIRVPDSRKARIKGRDVILVDDVMTSGATSEVCVGALLKAGARSVRIACFARVLDEALDAAA
ncbi:ComF family protein [Erythrobacter sp. HA6-11]